MTHIKLTIGSYSLDITRFGTNFGNEYPRKALTWPELNFSTRGTPIQSGTLYRPKHQWTFTALLSQADRLKLRRMLAAWLATTTTNWTIEDYTEEFDEASPRTRALATGATASDDSTTVLYYAKYYGFPTQYPALSEYAIDETVALQFTETEIFAA